MTDKESQKVSRQSNATASTNFHKTNQTVSFLLIPQIVILSPVDQKLQILSKADGDSVQIDPETEREGVKGKQRMDMFLNPILKGMKNHKITFRDQIKGEDIETVKYYIKDPEPDDDECCPCGIF